jgi:hypothetical protein
MTVNRRHMSGSISPSRCPPTMMGPTWPEVVTCGRATAQTVVTVLRLGGLQAVRADGGGDSDCGGARWLNFINDNLILIVGLVGFLVLMG